MTEQQPAATNQALTPFKQVSIAIPKMRDGLIQAAPKGMDVDRFIKGVLNLLATHPDHEKIAKADRTTIYTAVQKSVSDGLELNGREATIVFFFNKDKAQFDAAYMPMTQGLVKLARNSGEIAKIGAAVVHKKDKFRFVEGVDEMPVHEVDWMSEEDRGEPVLAWAYVKLTNGETISTILPKKKIMVIAGKSKNTKQYDPKDGPYFDEWWKKTAIKNALKYAPKSTELEKALKRGEKEEFDFIEHDAAGAAEGDQAASGEAAGHPKQTRAQKAVGGRMTAREAGKAKLAAEAAAKPAQASEEAPGPDSPPPPGVIDVEPEKEDEIPQMNDEDEIPL